MRYNLKKEETVKHFMSMRRWTELWSVINTIIIPIMCTLTIRRWCCHDRTKHFSDSKTIFALINFLVTILLWKQVSNVSYHMSWINTRMYITIRAAVKGDRTLVSLKITLS